MGVRRCCALLLCILAAGCMALPAAAEDFETAYLASIIPEPEQGGRVVVYDVLDQCMDRPGAGDGRATGGFAIENPFDRAFIITEIRMEVEGPTSDSVFFTLNRFAAHCAIDEREPDADLSLAAYAAAGSGNRSLMKRMLAGMEFLPARSVKYYNFLEAMWTAEPPRDVVLNLYLTLRPVGVEGVVYVDVDGNERRDEGEPVIAGARVYLCGSGGERLGLCYTDHRGYYQFPSPQPGTYYVEVTPPPGYSAGEGGIMPARHRSGELDVEMIGCLRRDVPVRYAGLDRVGVRTARLRRAG